MIRGSPSTRWVSLAKACRLSFVRAFAMAASVFATCAALNSPAYSATVFSTSRCAYQTVEVRLGGEFAHRRPVRGDGGQDDRAALLGREAAVAAGGHETDGEALDVPLPRTGMGLVEVVDVEHHVPLGRPEDPEVREMGIAAELHAHAGARRRGEIGRHDQRRTAVERERRHEHPPVADRHQLRHPRLRLLLEQPDRIGPGRRRLPLRVARARHLRTRRLPTCRTLDRRQMRNRTRSAARAPTGFLVPSVMSPSLHHLLARRSRASAAQQVDVEHRLQGATAIFARACDQVDDHAEHRQEDDQDRPHRLRPAAVILRRKLSMNTWMTTKTQITKTKKRIIHQTTSQKLGLFV